MTESGLICIFLIFPLPNLLNVMITSSVFNAACLDSSYASVIALPSTLFSWMSQRSRCGMYRLM